MSTRDVSLIQQLGRLRLSNAAKAALDTISPPLDVSWGDFAAGYNVNDASEDTGPNANTGGSDMEVDNKDRLVRAPGVSLLEALTRTPDSVVLHPSTQFTSELILFDPPFIGVKGPLATVWTDVGLRDYGVATALYADVLLLTNRHKTYFRAIRDTTIHEIVDAPAGEAIAVFGARVIIGAARIEGTLEGLGIVWSDAEGDHTSWKGLGAGNEFLLSGGPEADRIVSMVNMNLELLAILCRRSIWIAQLTGNGLAPFAFVLRKKGVGCVNRCTAQSTDKGVIFLSEDGVRGFDGTESMVLSDAINPELLPLINEGSGYNSSYDSVNHRYYLFVPGGPTYILDLLKGRWYKWSRTYTAGVDFPTQFPAITWDTVGALYGSWNTAPVLIWDDLLSKEGAHRHLLLRGASVGLEDRTVETDFGVPFYPKWSMPLALGDTLDAMFRTDLIEVRYEVSGTLRFNLPDNDGLYTAGQDLILPSTARTKHQNPFRTGLGMGLQVEIRAGFPKISRLHLRGRFQGQKQ